MKECSNCHSQFPDDELFCDQCGSKLVVEEPKVETYIYCPECGAKSPAEDKFCTSCGHPLMKVEKTTQKEFVPKKASTTKKKVPVKALVIVVLLAGVIAIVWKLNHFNGIKVDGKVYTFSAENGIDNYEDIHDGIFSMGGSSYAFWPIGATESQSAERMESSTYVRGGMGLVTNDGTIINGVDFVFSDDFKTSDGISNRTSEKQLQNKEYLNTPYGYYSQFFTEKGKLDWADIEEDFDNCREKGSCGDLYYYDTLVGTNDKMYFVLQDLDAVEAGQSDWDKKTLMWWMAEAKLGENLARGEIDYFYLQEVSVGEEGNWLEITVYANREDVQYWHDNWIKVD